MNEPDDSALRQALSKATSVFDRMADTRARVGRTPLPSFDQPRQVDSSMMYDIASLPGASAELKAYAQRVGAGECRWDDIESLSVPVPAEIAQLKADSMLIWFPESHSALRDDDAPYRIPWQ